MAHTRGRQPIGVDQPPNSGSSYPFVHTPAELQDLFADFYLFYEGPHDSESPAAYVYPFRIAWCYGFGTETVTPPSGWPAPENAYDLIVVDANDDIVFDSTIASAFTTSLWDSRLRIVEWTAPTRICRCVVHTEWTAADIADGQTRLYDEYIEPAAAVLVADTCFTPAKRLTSVKVGDTTVRGKPIEFVEGHNMSIGETANSAILVPTLNLSTTSVRTKHRVTFSAAPGLGLGRFPGCGEQAPELRTINNVPGNSHQNLTIDAEGCLRIQRPVIEIDDSPRQFAYWHSTLSDAQAGAAIELSNDCRNCCDCEYFARTYQGIKRQWFLYRDVAQSLEATRDLYAANRDRWLAEKAVREADILQVRAVIEGGGKVAWGISLCNASQCCLLGLKVYLTWVQYIDGVPSEPVVTPFDCSQTMIDNRSECDTPKAIVPIVYGDNRQIHCYVVDYLDAQTSLTIYGRQCIADSLNVDIGRAKLVLHAMVEWDATKEGEDAPASCLRTPLESEAVATTVRDVWTAASFDMPDRVFAQKLTDMKILDPSDPFCRRCQCEG